MYTLLFYLISSATVSYYTYRYTWLHIIKLFESINNVSNPIPSLLRTASSSGFLQLIATADDDVHKTTTHVEIVKHIARVAFTATITSTVVIIEFILVQLNRDFHDNDDESVHQFWGLLLLTMVTCLIFIQPGSMCYLIVNKLFKSRVLDKDYTKIMVSLSLMGGWLLLVSESYRLTDLSVVAGVGFLSYYVQRLSIIGVTLMAILNGVGSFSTVYYYLYRGLLCPQRKVTKEEAQSRVQMLEKSLQNTENMITTKELELTKQRNKDTHLAGARKPSFMDITGLQFMKPSESNTLQAEINSLKMIKNDIYVKLLKAQQQLEASTSSSYKATVTSAASKIISLYCVFKILQVFTVRTIQLFKSNDINSNKSDPLVLTLSHIAELFYAVEDEEVLVNQFSFIISGALFICSFNGVFMTLTHLYRFLPIDLSKLESSSTTSSPKNQKSVSVVKNLIVSQLVGIYVLATITILKSNLTSSVESKLSEMMLTTGLDMVIVDNWFDKVFLISVVCTGVVIKVGEMWTNGENEDGFEEQQLMGKIV